MKFGFYLPTRGHTATSEALETVVSRGEALGFHSVVIADHVVFPTEVHSTYPYTLSGAFPGHGDAMEQLTLLAFVAGITRRLRLVTSVMILPYRHPVLTAKMLATVDVLSKGRLTVGVGVGWLREEFEALGAQPFEQRGAVSNEYLEIFKTLWTQDPATFAGKFYQFHSLHCLPHPLQKPHPPIWIGGHSRPALRRVARYGDGWHPVGANPAVPLRPEELRLALDELKRLVEAEGRDPESISITFKAPLYDVSPNGQLTQPTAHERRPFSGSPAQVVDDIAAYGRLGVSELIFDFRTEDLSESLERMEHFASVIKPVAEAVP